MEKLVNENFIREITPLSDKDCFYIADRHKKEFTYPMHSHKEFELNFVEHAPGVRRVVGDSAEVIGDYDLVLITSPDLEHVWEQNTCSSSNIREITIQFVPAFLSGLIDTNQFDMIRKMLDKAQYGLCFPMDAVMKVYALIDKLPEMKGFYAVVHFLTLLYELSLFTDQARTLSSSSFAKIEVHSDSRRVQKVQDYIGKHYQEEIRLGLLADMVGMTEVSFSRFFKLRTGKNLSDYIIDLRLGVASLMYTSPEKDKAVFYWWKTEHFVNQHLPRVTMAGLNPDKKYRITELNRIDNQPLAFEGKVYSGAYLMANGLEIPYNHIVDYHKQNDYSSRVLYLEEVQF